jgi:hypothetical protein
MKIGKCPTELAMEKHIKRWIYSNMVRHVPLGCIVYCSKRSIDQKLSFAQLLGNGRIRWTYLNHGCNGSFSRANNICCYSVLIQATYDHVLPIARGQRKLTYFIYFSWLPIEAALSIFNISFFLKPFFRWS